MAYSGEVQVKFSVTLTEEEEAEGFASAHKENSWYEDFMILFKMITTADYSISNKTKLIIAGTLAYVVLPIDVIPDFIPVVGWLDDAFVLGLAMTTLSDEIEKFKNQQGNLTPVNHSIFYRITHL